MSHKKSGVITAEVFIQNHPHASEHAHLFEHVHFLEERASVLENRVERLNSIFRDLLEVDEQEDEYEDEEDDENEEDAFFNPNCCCLRGLESSC